MVESSKLLNEQASASEGFAVGTTLVARWMGKTESMCIVIDRSTWTYVSGRKPSPLAVLTALFAGSDAQQRSVQVLRALARGAFHDAIDSYSSTLLLSLLDYVL